MSDDAGQQKVPTIYDRLAERFPASAHKTKNIGGRDLTYVDGEMVISRLNEVLGFDGWSFETGNVTVTDLEVWVTGKLTVYSGERTIVREQAGGQIINRKRTGEVIELSNDIKGAVTDCLKKCATLVGVGLYLYDPSERREVEQEMREAKRGNPPQRQQTAPAATSAAGPGSRVSPSADTRSTTPAAPSSSSTTDISARSTPEVDAAARLTGAAETPLKQWERLVAQAEQIGLPTLGAVKAVDARALPMAQLNGYIKRLNQSIATFRGQQQGAA